MARDDATQIREVPILELPIESAAARSRSAMDLPADTQTEASATTMEVGVHVAPPAAHPPPSPPPWLGQAWAWLRSRVMVGIGAAGIGGAGFAWGGAGATATEADLAKLETATEADINELETATEADIDDLSARLTNLEPLVDVVERAHNMSALALEIAVESHHYTADLIVDVAKLDHPDYHPPNEDVRLQRRLRQGGDVVDEIGASRP